MKSSIILWKLRNIFFLTVWLQKKISQLIFFLHPLLLLYLDLESGTEIRDSGWNQSSGIQIFAVLPFCCHKNHHIENFIIFQLLKENFFWQFKKNYRNSHNSVLRILIRVPVPFWPLDLWSGMGRKSASGSGMNNPDHIFKSFETNFWGLKYFKSLMLIRDGDSSDPGSRMGKSRIRDKHSGSATLQKFVIKLSKICVLDPGSRLLHLHVHFNLPKCNVCVQIRHPFTNLWHVLNFFY